MVCFRQFRPILLHSEYRGKTHVSIIVHLRYQIATDLTMERYALIFGANNFGALVLQTIITSVVVDSRGLGLAIIPQVSSLVVVAGWIHITEHLYPLITETVFSSQFIIYASYFSIIAVVFSLRGLYTIWRVQRSSKDLSSPVHNDPPECPEPQCWMKGIQYLPTEIITWERRKTKQIHFSLQTA